MTLALADLAIGACGSASWERCCVGLPAVVVAIADNQVSIGEGLDARGACVYLGTAAAVNSAALAQAMRRLLTHPVQVRELSVCAHALVDGLGAQRVAQVLEQAA